MLKPERLIDTYRHQGEEWGLYRDDEEGEIRIAPCKQMYGSRQVYLQDGDIRSSSPCPVPVMLWFISHVAAASSVTGKESGT